MSFINPAICWLIFICFLTLLGNVLVILAVYRETSLHSATYYYIVSLAVADLCVGVIVIPLAILFELTTPQPFDFLCHLWHVTDVCASTASILALCVISLDRYIAITSPIRYPRSFLSQHSSIVIALIWFCSSIIAGPTVMILGKNSIEFEEENVKNLTQRSNSNDKLIERCEFPSDPVFIVVSSFVSFYIPLIIMVFVYGRILVYARRQMAAFRQGYKRTTVCGEISPSPSGKVPRIFFRSTKSKETNLNETDHQLSSNLSPSLTCSTTIPLTNPERITLRIHRGKYSRSPSLALAMSRRTRSSHLSFPLLILRRLRKLRRTRTWTRFSREHKATKVLGIVMGVFIACWLPFFVFLLLNGVFHIEFYHWQEHLFRIFTWLGYTNSAVSSF